MESWTLRRANTGRTLEIRRGIGGRRSHGRSRGRGRWEAQLKSDFVSDMVVEGGEQLLQCGGSGGGVGGLDGGGSGLRWCRY